MRTCYIYYRYVCVYIIHTIYMHVYVPYILYMYACVYAIYTIYVCMCIHHIYCINSANSHCMCVCRIYYVYAIYSIHTFTLVYIYTVQYNTSHYIFILHIHTIFATMIVGHPSCEGGLPNARVWLWSGFSYPVFLKTFVLHDAKTGQESTPQPNSCILENPPAGGVSYDQCWCSMKYI